jgi:hypothetical protein
LRGGWNAQFEEEGLDHAIGLVQHYVALLGGALNVHYGNARWNDVGAQAGAHGKLVALEAEDCSETTVIITA